MDIIFYIYLKNKMSEHKFFNIIKITDSKDVKISSINTYKKI